MVPQITQSNEFIPLKTQQNDIPYPIIQELIEKMTTDAKNARWVCLECHWIYDPAMGDPKNGIPAGTPWDDVPDTWRCPECKIFKAKKGVFKRLDD